VAYAKKTRYAYPKTDKIKINSNKSGVKGNKAVQTMFNIGYGNFPGKQNGPVLEQKKIGKNDRYTANSQEEKAWMKKYSKYGPCNRRKAIFFFRIV
jgi:hypothetical protein